MELTFENITEGLKGYHRIVDCENGYQVSIISHSFSYGGPQGLFEVALLNDKGVIIYDESLGFSDVVGHLEFEDVGAIIKAIRSLSPRN
jgi:hypothetical protein